MSDIIEKMNKQYEAKITTPADAVELSKASAEILKADETKAARRYWALELAVKSYSGSAGDHIVDMAKRFESYLSNGK